MGPGKYGAASDSHNPEVAGSNLFPTISTRQKRNKATRGLTDKAEAQRLGLLR